MEEFSSLCVDCTLLCHTSSAHTYSPRNPLERVSPAQLHHDPTARPPPMRVLLLCVTSQVPLLPEGLAEPPHSTTAPEGKSARAFEILYSKALSWLKPRFCFLPKGLAILCSIVPHKQQSRVARHSRSYGGVSVGGNIEIMDTIMHSKPFQVPKLVEKAWVPRTLFSKNFFPRQRTHRVDRSLVRIGSWWMVTPLAWFNQKMQIMSNFPVWQQLRLKLGIH